MRKLNKKKVRWIIKQMLLGEMSVWNIAKIQEITPRWARKLLERYQKTKEFSFQKQPGREATPIPAETVLLVERTYKRTPIGAVKMEQLLDHNGTHIPHNTIHTVLKARGYAHEQPNKSRRRK